MSTTKPRTPLQYAEDVGTELRATGPAVTAMEGQPQWMAAQPHRIPLHTQSAAASAPLTSPWASPTQWSTDQGNGQMTPFGAMPEEPCRSVNPPTLVANQAEEHATL